MSSVRPFFTIGIASYNYAKLMPKAFEQLKKQEFRDFEVLYCDDGSKDNSCEVIEGFIADNPDMNIRLVRAENGGILANKNRIVEHARGRYLMVCDADDFMADDCLKKLHDAAVSVDADCVIGAFEEMDKEGNIIKQHLLPENPVKWLYSQHHAQVYKLDIVREHGIRFEQLPDDVLYLQSIHLYCRKVAYVYDPIYIWYRHENSVSTNTAVHTDWDPTKIWTKLVHAVGPIMNQVTDQADRDALEYYLIKYYFINATDTRSRSLKTISATIRGMKAELKKVWPEYAGMRSWRKVRYISDTAYSKKAIELCAVLDMLHCLALSIFIKSKMR